MAGNRNTDGSFNNLSSNGNFWSSHESSTNAWNRNLNSGNATVNRNTNGKTNGFSVRCLKHWQTKKSAVKFMDQLLYDLFQAYYDARKNKRNTINALAFEIDYETKLFKLYEDLKSGRYQIGRSICFISFNPVKREVFAADFRDRIVHHFIYNCISPVFERFFINDSYSCRTGKGTLYGIKRMEHFTRSCSENYSKNCFVLKLDIKGYFMSIDKNILWQKIESPMRGVERRGNLDCEIASHLLAMTKPSFLLSLIHKVVFHDPVKNCIIKGIREDWAGLPKSKSLFFAGKDKGLPIGNLTSQLFGNIYLNDFDHFVKYKLGCKYYGRYVDDFVIMHRNKEYLKSIIPAIKKYLAGNFLLKIHPNKIQLQDYKKGFKFLGTIIKPYRIYICNKTKGNFYRHCSEACSPAKQFRTMTYCLNSYLGLMRHFNTYKLRMGVFEKGWGGGLKAWQEKFIISPGYKKIILKNENNKQKIH